jgi:hypothetical protein
VLTPRAQGRTVVDAEEELEMEGAQSQISPVTLIVIVLLLARR